ncbi:MAG: hypothetical protein AAB544_00525 [Patescibacteria group bacterium]
MASPLDLANLEFRAVSSEPDRMKIFITRDIRSRIGTIKEIGELIKVEDHWYLNEGYFQDHPGSDVRNVIGMEGYCQIIHSANQLLAFADHASDTGGGGANHRNDDADAASIDASE